MMCSNRRRWRWIDWLPMMLAWTGISTAAELPNGSAAIPRAMLDITLRPPTIHHAPGPEYSDEARDYAMTLGIERTPGGRLWAAWIAGGDSERGLAVVATSDDQGQTWSHPVMVIDPSDVPNLPPLRVLVGNLWTDPRGRLWFFFDYAFGYFDGRAGTWAICCEKPDAERPEWSPPQRIWHGAALNKPTVLADGTWLLPISLWDRGKIRPREEFGENFPELDSWRMLNVFASRDQGESWQRIGGVQIPQPSFDEATIVQRRDGSLWLLARSNVGIMESTSSDGGHTWTEPAASPIGNVVSRHALRRLASGRLLLVKHGQQVATAPAGRSHLTAFVSDDDGRTWQGGLLLDERLGVSYPDAVETPDGQILVSYDHQRSREREILFARFTEADVLAGRLTSAGSQLRCLVSKATGQLRQRTAADRDPMPLPYLERRPEVVPVHIGRQLLVDDYLIESTTLARQFHQPQQHPANPIFRASTSEELDRGAVTYLGHGGVFYDPGGERFRMWYTAGWRGGLAYAQSEDGLTWTRPEGPAGGNLLLPPGRIPEGAGGDNCVWLDLAAPPSERIKLLAHSGNHYLLASPDGRSWSKPIEAGRAGDYCSFFYNPFRRKWVFSIKAGFKQARIRHYHEHDDFWMAGQGWNAGQRFWLAADRLDEPLPDVGEPAQLYSLNAVAYESLLLGMLYIHKGPHNDICRDGRFPKHTELHLAYSRDGLHWDRSNRQPFLSPTRREGDWNRAYLHGTAGICLVVGDRLHFYYTAYSGENADGQRDMYHGGSIGLATLRRDGFASLNADSEPGELVTRPLLFTGHRLFVNADCAAGELRAELLDEQGSPIEPFTLGRCRPMHADATRAELQWAGAEDLAPCVGRPVRIRFQLTQGKLYSFWLSSDPQGASGGYLAAGGPGYAGTIDLPVQSRTP